MPSQSKSGPNPAIRLGFALTGIIYRLLFFGWILNC